MEVKQDTISIISMYENKPVTEDLIEKLGPKRNWFSQNAYRCLPLTIANQHGYIIRSPYDFWVEWDGGPGVENVKFAVNPEHMPHDNFQHMKIASSFGLGIFTFYPAFLVKTPKHVSTWVKQPPNCPKAGISWMEAVVETDNLDSSFSFNLKLTDPGRRIHFKKGEPIACFMPFPRYFVDDFKVDIHPEKADADEIRRAQQLFGEIRTVENETRKNNHFYIKGKNFNGCPFKHGHQKSLKQNPDREKFQIRVKPSKEE